MAVKDTLMPHGDEGFAFFCFRIFAQMCGKLGSRSLQGSLFMTESQFQRFRPGLDALQQLRTLEAGSAYNAFLLLQGSKALSRFASPEHQALARLLCLGAASDYERGDAVCRAFDELSVREREVLTRWLTADGISQRPGYVLCDAPRLLQNAEANPAVGLGAALHMLVSVEELCTLGWGVHKVYVHLNELADWAQDAGKQNGAFEAAQLDVQYEDVAELRIFRVHVARPQGGSTRGSGQLRRRFCCQLLGSGMLLLLLVGSLAGALGLLMYPNATEPYLDSISEPVLGHSRLPTDLVVKALGGFSVVMLLLLLLCCRGLCRGGSCCGTCCTSQGCFGRLCGCAFCCNWRLSGGGEGSKHPVHRTPSSRPLLCNYTLLGPDNSPV